MQTNRLFEIIYLLMDKKKMTAAELAERLGVSKRTILRDINTLLVAGIPLYTLQGKGGGIALMDNYVLNKATLTKEEQNQILFALQSLSAMQSADEDRVLSKLQSFFQKAHTSWIEVDLSRWGSAASDKRRFEILKEALLTERALSFVYVDSSGSKSNRTVFPLKLVFKSRAWYLQAFCTERQDYRTFRISRMLRLEDANESFVREDYTAPAIEANKVPARYLTELELHFPPHVAHRVYDEFDEGAVEEDESGWLRVCARMPNDAWLKGFLDSFGADINIIRHEPIPPLNEDL